MKEQRDNQLIKHKFEKLYERESDAIFRYCLFRVSDSDSALDLTQEAFMKFWDSLVKGKEIVNERAFIFMIARNLVIDLYRKKKSLSLDSILEENEDQMFMAGANGGTLDIEMSTEARFVMNKLKDLEPIHQQIVYLRFVEDLKPKEIAEILGVTPNVVSVRIIRGIEKLRELTGYDINEHE